MNRNASTVRDCDCKVLQIPFSRDMIGRCTGFHHGEPVTMLEVGKNLCRERLIGQPVAEDERRIGVLGISRDHDAA